MLAASQSLLSGATEGAGSLTLQEGPTDFPKHGVLFKRLNTEIHVKQQELPFVAGGNDKCYDHFGGQFGRFLPD